MSSGLIEGQNLVVVSEGVVVRDNTQVVAINHDGDNTKSAMVANLLRSGCPAVQVVFTGADGAADQVLNKYDRNLTSLEASAEERFDCVLAIGKRSDDLHVITVTRSEVTD